MKRMTRCCAIFAVCLIAFLGGCSKGNPSGASTGNDYSQYVVSPSVIITPPSPYEVEQAWIGRSSSASTYIYGVIKIRYLGTIDQKYINLTASFTNSGSAILFTESSYVRNPAMGRTEYGTNLNTFFTPTYNTGYYFVIEDLNGRAVTDITRVLLTIAGTSFTYAPALGNLSKTGNPYRVEPDSWYLGVCNDGDRPVSESFSYFVFKDALSRLFYWSFVTSYIDSSVSSAYEMGKCGYFKRIRVTPDYISTPLDFSEACIAWSPAKSAATIAKKAASADERNELLLREIDNLTRAEQVSSR